MTESDWQRACYDDVAGQLAEARDEVDRLRGLLERAVPFVFEATDAHTADRGLLAEIADAGVMA